MLRICVYIYIKIWIHIHPWCGIETTCSPSKSFSFALRAKQGCDVHYRQIPPRKSLLQLQWLFPLQTYQLKISVRSLPVNSCVSTGCIFVAVCSLFRHWLKQRISEHKNTYAEKCSAEGYPTLNLNSRTKISHVCIHISTYVMVLKQTLDPQTTKHLLLLCHIWKSANALWEMWKM